MKYLLRSKVYWYSMDKDIEDFFASCLSCQELSVPNKSTPVKMTNLPKEPWEKIAADFMVTYQQVKNS